MIVVLGEQVADRLVQPDGSLVDVAGGAPANVAVALAALGDDVALRARISSDAFGDLFRARLGVGGVRTDLLVPAAGPSSSAVVHQGPAYDFALAGAVDFGWTDDELGGPDPDVLVCGSLAMAMQPAAAAVERLVARTSARVFYDPNLRPSLGLPGEAQRVARQVTLADVVKVSEEDCLLLGPDARDTARAWSADRLVVLTLGPQGCVAFRRGREVASADGRRVEVADTVGAGDVFLAGLVHALADADLDTVELSPALDLATRLSAVACTHAGAYAPTLSEV